MNKKFFSSAVLFIITFGLSNQALLTHLKAQTNTFYGQGAGNNTSGDFNSGFGYFTLSGANSGSENTAIGDSALLHNTTGSWNTASGSFALYHNTTGDNNTASGFNALLYNTTGNYNMATIKEQSAQIQKASARLAAARPSSGGLEASNAVCQTPFKHR